MGKVELGGVLQMAPVSLDGIDIFITIRHNGYYVDELSICQPACPALCMFLDTCLLMCKSEGYAIGSPDSTNSTIVTGRAHVSHS